MLESPMRHDTQTEKQQNMAGFLIIAIVGILGNLFALINVVRRSPQNKFTMLLKYLMSNNLIALTGVTIMFTLRRCLSENLIQANFRAFCSCWVIFRCFGMCSGCIAVFMSIERYLSICHVFFHYSYWSPKLNKISIIGLSCLAAVLTFLPFLGFGIYIDEGNKECIRYRDAKTSSDRAYAILFFVFGTLISTIIVTFDTFVLRALLYKLPREMERLNLLNHGTTSRIEIQLSKTMMMLDLSFIICWMPEMISIILALWKLLPQKHWYYELADVLMVLHFTLDPFIYVMSGKNLQCFCNIMRCWTSNRTAPSIATTPNRRLYDSLN